MLRWLLLCAAAFRSQREPESGCTKLAQIQFIGRVSKAVALKIVKRVLLIGWPLLFVDGLLILYFPNASWNNLAGSAFLILCPALFAATLGFLAFLTIRPLVRLVKKHTPPVAESAFPVTNPKVPLRRILALGFLGLLAILAFIVPLMMSIEQQFKSSDPYRMSMAAARSSPDVLEKLGSPIDAGWLVSGEISVSTGGGGSATLTIPLRGPKSKGRLYVEAARQAGTWRISSLEFLPDRHAAPIDLSARQ